MKKELIERLNKFFNENSNLRGVSTSEDEIILAEKELDIKFDKDYKQFISLFGGAYAGISIHAFKNASSLGKETVVELTKMGRKLFNQNEIFSEINNCLVFSDDGSGNPICINEEGKIILFDFDTENYSVLANSFEELIENNFFEW